MRSQIRRDKLKGDGTESPLKSIKDKVLILLKCMNNIKHMLTLQDGVSLVNNLITDIPVQAKLIKWEKSRKIYHKDESKLGEVGTRYFHSFLERYKHCLREKSIDKYAIDRSNKERVHAK